MGIYFALIQDTGCILAVKSTTLTKLIKQKAPSEYEISTEFFEIQINFENLTLLAPLTFKNLISWLRPRLFLCNIIFLAP